MPLCVSMNNGSQLGMDVAMQIKEKTFQQERGRLLNFIRSRVGSLEDAEDILQDVFYQFSAGFETIDSIDSVTSWLYAVARNKIIDRYRRQASRPRTAELEQPAGNDEDTALSLADILPDLSNTPEETILRDVIWDAITEALDELPEAQREVFILNEIEEKSFREIADEKGVSINTLLSRKRYAIQALRKRLQRVYNDILNI